MPENRAAATAGKVFSLESVGKQLGNHADRSHHAGGEMEVAKVRKFARFDQHALTLGTAGERTNRAGRIDRRLITTDDSSVERMHAEIRYRRKVDAGTFTNRHATRSIGKRIARIVVGNKDFGLATAVLEFGIQAIVQSRCD